MAAIRHLETPSAAKLTAQQPELAAQVPLPNTLNGVRSVVKITELLSAQVTTVKPLDGLHVRADFGVAIHSEIQASCVAPEATLYFQCCHFLLTFIIHQLVKFV